MEIRKVHIEEYWPLIVKNIEEFGQIAVAENEEFNRITKCIYDALNDCFILEATEYGVGRWEKILGIVPAEGSTLDERKATILSYLSVKIPYTLPVLRQMLIALLGEGNFEMSLDNDTQTLTVKLAITVTQTRVSEVKSLLSRVVPYNLVIEMEWSTGLPVMDEYMPIEYVDIVKLFSHDSVITTNALDVELDAQFVYNGLDWTYSNLISSPYTEGHYGDRLLEYFVPSYMTEGLRMVNHSANREYFPTGVGLNSTNAVIGRYNRKIPTYITRKQVHIHDCGYDMDGKFYQFEPSAIINDVNWGKMRFGCGLTSKGNHWRIWRCTVRQNGVMTADLIPCVRISDGSVGLWCNVYKKFYDQSPVATLALDWELDEDNGVTYVNLEEVIENE